MKHLTHGVHQSWKKSWDNALGCSVCPAGELLSWRHIHCQHLWVLIPFKRLQKELTPDIFQIIGEKKEMLLVNITKFSFLQLLLFIIYSGYSCISELNKAGAYLWPPALMNPLCKTGNFSCVPWPWIVTATSHHPPFQNESFWGTINSIRENRKRQHKYFWSG